MTTSTDREHLDVLVVGAGLSGVAAGHYVQTTCPWASYAVFEARDAIGGTWDLFRYPGVRSDSDMFTLGYSFHPWPGKRSIADGESILRYIRDTAAREGIDEHIRFGHRVVAASWSTDDARWTVRVERADTGESFELTCGFLLSCTGYYRYDRGHQPEFEGIERFAGTVVHPQAWPDDLDVTGKRVVVIGSGATAITLVPSLAATAEHVTMLQRSPSYVVSVPAVNPVALALRRVLPRRLSAPAIRWFHALTTQGFYQFSRRRPSVVKAMLRKGIERQLPRGYDVATHFTPGYDPWDQRLCLAANGDLFSSIRDGRASVVTDHIDTFTESGLRLRSGEVLDADVVVTATGLELLFVGGMTLSVDGEPVEIADRLTYKGMMLEGVPNFAVAVGYTNASWTLKCELTCEYACRLVDHLHRTGLRQCTPLNDDDTVSPQPLLGLTSGYVLRSAHLFPKQGTRYPWQVHQSYLRDYRALRLGSVDDGVMRFSNPAPSATHAVSAARAS
jgi:cation diffusion facilitator CzcD-associated flavoprotein CzcO